MLVLGIQGSPRKMGNTDRLLSVFMDEAVSLGAQTKTINPDKMNIKPCIGCRLCEKKGFCAIKDDDMTNEVDALLWKADLIVTASPIFFYSVPAQLKSLIDRSQTLWSRKYMLKLEDPLRKWRRGILIAIGATRGKNLFEGTTLTAKYFYDAVGAAYDGHLAYRRIENPGEILEHPTAVSDVKSKARELVKPLLARKKIIFVCRENACRSQMSSAFAQVHAGDKLEVMSGGDEPAEHVNSAMEQVMAEKGIDMAYRKPQSITGAIEFTNPDIVVTMGCEVSCPNIPGARIIEWDLPDPEGKPIEFMRELRDIIEKKILELIKDF